MTPILEKFWSDPAILLYILYPSVSGTFLLILFDPIGFLPMPYYRKVLGYYLLHDSSFQFSVNFSKNK